MKVVRKINRLWSAFSRCGSGTIFTPDTRVHLRGVTRGRMLKSRMAFRQDVVRRANRNLVPGWDLSSNVFNF